MNLRRGAAAGVLGLALALTTAFCGGRADAAAARGPSPGEDGLYDVACAVCVYGQTGEGCPLAVRIGDRIVPVEGATVAEHSICDAVQRARVEGRLEGEVFVATSVTLVP